MRLSLFVAFGLLAVASALYTAKDDVVELTSSNFRKEVIGDSGVWLVEFYAPWCGHCKNLAPEWKKAATALKGVVKVGGVDMDAHASVGQPYEVTGFPTIKVFGGDKSKPVTYQGERTAAAIVDFAMKEASKVVKARLGGKAGSEKASGGSGAGAGDKKKSGSGGANAVIELDEDSFNAQVLGSTDPWMVEFYAPWCGHCKNLAPEWASAASQLQDRGVKLGAVDATQYSGLAQKYGVRGYPTIKVFPQGGSGPVNDYEGGRTASAIVSFASKLAEENAVAPEVLELTSQSVWDEQCADTLCVVAFLPHILDSGASGRNSYLEMLRANAAHYKTRNFRYVWTEGFQQQALEQAVDVGGFGYPALAVVNQKKERYTRMVLAFTEPEIKEFLRRVLAGSEKTVPTKVPAIVKTTPWDGKDGQLLEEDY